MLAVAIGVLAIAGATLIMRSALVGVVRLSKERAAFASQRHDRDVRRAASPVERIFAEHWDGPPVGSDRFKQIWTSLARYLEIDAELMRPGDRVAEVVVATEHFGPDCNVLVEFIRDYLPHADPDDVLRDIAGDESVTIGDLIGEILSRQERPR